MTVLFVFDEGPGRGLGHRRRCAVIAAALRERGLECVELPLAGSVDAPIVVVDSYAVRADDRRRFRAGRVIALDDLARDLDVAVVVDPAPGASTAPHRRAGRVLAGAGYALVDPAVRALRDLHGDRPDREPKTVLVATGAADSTGVGVAMASALAGSDLGLDVRLVVGPWGARPGADTRAHGAVEIVERVDGLAPELVAADIVVTAAGVTLLEAMCLGRPTVAVATAPNQRGNLDGVLAAGAALGATPDRVVEAVARLVADRLLRGVLTRAATGLIDGRGSDRVADVIAELAVQVAA